MVCIKLIMLLSRDPLRLVPKIASIIRTSLLRLFKIDGSCIKFKSRAILKASKHK